MKPAMIVLIYRSRSRSLASAILNRKRPMSLSVIRKLSSAWDLPTDILVQPYRLQGERSTRAA
jgi:hypothetical protein